MFNSEYIRIKNVDIRNLLLETEENNFSIGEFNFNNLRVKDINGSFNKNFEGFSNFLFFDGKGNLIFKFSLIEPAFTGKFSIKNIDINKFATSFNEKIIIKGFINIFGNFNISKNNLEIETIFNSVKKEILGMY